MRTMYDKLRINNRNADAGLFIFLVCAALLIAAEGLRKQPHEDNNPMLDRPRDALKSAAVLTLLVAAAVAVTDWPVLDCRAKCLDHDLYVTDNHLVLNPGLDSAIRFFSEVQKPSTVGGYYQPLTMISLMGDVRLGAGPDNFRPFHRTNLILHVANAVLIVLILYRLFGHAAAAAAAGLLFGLHPITVEPLAWIVERKTMLSSFFALLALLLYLRFAKAGCGIGQGGACRRPWGLYAASLFAFILSLLSKPTTTPLPIILLILNAWPLKRISKSAGLRQALETLPYFLIAFISAFVSYISQANAASVEALGKTHNPLLILCYNVFFYARGMATAMSLTPYNPFPEPMTLANGQILLAVLVTAAMAAAVLISLRFTPAIAAGAAVFMAALLPATGLAGQFTKVVASDKYAYFPALGVLIILCWALRKTIDSIKTHPAALAFPGMMLLGIAALEAHGARTQLGFWKDSEALARRMTALAPGGPVGHYELGNALKEKADSLERRGASGGDNTKLRDPALFRVQAFRAYDKAFEINPCDGRALNNMAGLSFQLGRTADAAKWWTRLLEVEPSNFRARANLSYLRFKLGEEAERKGLNLESLALFGEALTGYERALSDFRKESPGRPDDPRMLSMVGLLRDKLRSSK